MQRRAHFKALMQLRCVNFYLIKSCGEMARKLRFIKEQVLKEGVSLKVPAAPVDVNVDDLEAGEFFRSASSRATEQQREYESRQQSEESMETPFLQEKKKSKSSVRVAGSHVVFLLKVSKFEEMGLLGSSFVAVALFLGVFLNVAVLSTGGKTSTFVRKVEKTVDMPLDSDVFEVPSGYNAPQQVHITQGDLVGKAVIVSWVTEEEPGSSAVHYWNEKSKEKKLAKGKYVTYRFFNYTSGFIHHCTIRNLEYNTKYYYEVGIGHTTRQFWFITPPEIGPDVPYTFGLIGDLGQSYDSNKTLTHYELNPTKGQTLLFVGDLSYADNYPNHDNVRWDTWGRFIERSAAYQPWIWTAGNHEIDFAPEINESKPFKPYTHRYHVPYEASQSTEPFWYSIKRASAHIIVLASYSAYGKYTPQYRWLEAELLKVNRTETPWLIVLMHSPWYNSYNYHYMEGETMRVMYEPWFVQYKVDLVFAGHVHAYERSERISNVAYNVVNGLCTPVKNQSAPVYITIGDGGNLEGLATNMTEPQPKYSAYREASFGHAILDIKNRTHAYYGWHRNQDGYAVEADTMWFFNRYWHPVDDSTSHESD